MTEKIGEFSEAHLLGVAKGLVEKKTKDSKILDAEMESRIPKFDAGGELSRCGPRDRFVGKMLMYLFRTFHRTSIRQRGILCREGSYKNCSSERSR